jgi:hypothetical protein
VSTSFHTVEANGLNVFYRPAGDPETEAPLEGFLEPAAVKSIYLTGRRRPELISPDNWNMDLFFLSRPHAHRVQLDLPDARLVRLVSGRFAVEDSLAEIASQIRDFYRAEVSASR